MVSESGLLAAVVESVEEHDGPVVQVHPPVPLADHLDLLEKMILANVNIPATEDNVPMEEFAYCNQ